MSTMTRRDALGAVPVLSALPAAAKASSGLSAAEIARRVDHHIECIKALAQALDPSIRDWMVTQGTEGRQRGILAMVPYRVHCAYTGDGRYSLRLFGECEVTATRERKGGQPAFLVAFDDGKPPSLWGQSALEDSIVERVR